MVSWFLSGLEGLDDDHGSAAARTGLCEACRLIGLGGGFGLVLWCRQVEQLTRPGEVLDAPAIGKKAIMANAVEAQRQDVNEEEYQWVSTS